jgi:hypothetical protein
MIKTTYNISSVELLTFVGTLIWTNKILSYLILSVPTLNKTFRLWLWHLTGIWWETWNNKQHAFKIDITQITYKNKVCKHTRFTNTLHTIQHSTLWLWPVLNENLSYFLLSCHSKQIYEKYNMQSMKFIASIKFELKIIKQI